MYLQKNIFFGRCRKSTHFLQFFYFYKEKAREYPRLNFLLFINAVTTAVRCYDEREIVHFQSVNGFAQ